MTGDRAAPLVWGLSISAAAFLAVLLGVYDVGWGVALSFPAATLILSVGTLRERRDAVLPMVLRAVVGATIGFTAATIVMTLHGLSGGPETAQVTAFREAIWRRWVVMPGLIPLGVYALISHRRSRPLEGEGDPT